MASTARDWKNTILAGLANYIDAGSIVSGSAALALWASTYKLSPTFIGVLGAFSANAISAGVGALIGGRLCDMFGRKKIYQYDMLFYAFGMLWLVFAVQPWMIVVGFILVGLAVGADIPASWSLIAEMAPPGARGKHSGVAQMLWYLGPVVVLGMFFVVAPLGILGARLVFAHLAIVAIVLTLFRSRMKESAVWEAAKAERGDDPIANPAMLRALFAPKNLKSMLFLIGMYGIWNLWAGTNGFFFPYILRTVGSESQATSVAMQAAGFSVAMLSICFVFMRYSDRINQRLLFATSAVIQIGGMAMLAVFPLTTPIALTYVALVWFGSGFGAQSFFQLWSAELFPTLIRSTAQGLTFAVVRIGLGLWSFLVPVLTATGFRSLAWTLTGFLIVSGLIGTIWAPRNEGKTLDEIQAERLAL
ncbi:MAG TPA: MFS transporter [Caulobacteraceae bacterium]|jgi:inositol transporter-like SP family MFS transporter|nr:MFS transporter [Caulobacteraceae bacterium]